MIGYTRCSHDSAGAPAEAAAVHFIVMAQIMVRDTISVPVSMLAHVRPRSGGLGGGWGLGGGGLGGQTKRLTRIILAKIRQMFELLLV